MTTPSAMEVTVSATGATKPAKESRESAKNSKTSAEGLSKDSQLMLMIKTNSKSKANINWQQVAVEMDYKDGCVAASRFDEIIKKYDPKLNDDTGHLRETLADGTPIFKVTPRTRTMSSEVQATVKYKPWGKRKALAESKLSSARKTKEEGNVSDPDTTGGSNEDKLATPSKRMRTADDKSKVKMEYDKIKGQKSRR